MIDLSDGLASDAARISEESGVALEMRLGSLPLDEGVDAVARMAARPALSSLPPRVRTTSCCSPLPRTRERKSNVRQMAPGLS